MENRTRGFTCDDCGKSITDPDNALELREGVFVCGDCAEHYCICEDCGETVWYEDCYYVAEKTVCFHCLCTYYSQCADCGTWVPDTGSARNHHGDLICNNCLDNYFYCAGCEELYPCHDAVEIDGDWYCEDCAEELRGEVRGIQPYHSTPRIEFFSVPEKEKLYAGNTRYFGIELEIDDGGEDDENADALTDMLDPDVWRAEHDGSISNGFELISMPVTLPWMEEHLFPLLPDFCKEAVDRGYRGHDAESSCGLHVHVSRNTFTEEELGKLILLMDRFWPFFLRFSRRTAAAMSDWAARYDLENEGTGPDKAERAKSLTKAPKERYRALNLTNRDTIEFRLFRSSLNPNTVEATIRFVAWLCDYVATVPTADIETMEHLPVGGIHPSLDRYLTERLLTPPDRPLETALSRLVFEHSA